MREIKFRAWDGKAKDWHTFEITDNLFESQQAISFGLLGGQVESLVWQQYTGLKDRNGVEIYEGDIITQDGYAQHVQWSDMGAWWALVNIPNVHSGNHLSALDFDECEVIGNIYENPELLERIESDE